MSRSTPSPTFATGTSGMDNTANTSTAPATMTTTAAAATNGARHGIARRPLSPQIEVTSDSGSGSDAATARPATVIRRTSGSTRPSTQQTVIQGDYPPPLKPSSAAFQHSDNRLPQRRNDHVLASSLDAGTSRQHGGSSQAGERAAGRSLDLPRAQAFGITTTIQATGSGSAPNNATVVSPVNNSRTQNWSWQAIRAGNPVPTPGIDPTPELRFAIDQLTRDEEIRGYGRDSFIEAPVTGRQPTSDAQEGEQTATKRESVAFTAPSSRYSNASERDTSRRFSDWAGRPSAASDAPFVTQYAKLMGEPGRPFALNRTSVVSNRYDLAADEDYENHVNLKSVPKALGCVSVLGLALLCVFMIVTGVIASVHSAVSGGLARYDGTGTGIYLVFKYLPQLVAAVIVLWLHTIQDAIQRILPFVLLVPHTKKPRETDILSSVRRYKSTFLMPDVSVFRDGEFGLGACNIVFWMALFTVPLASVAFTPVYYHQSDDTAYWRWGAIQGVCWTLLCLYFFLTIALIFVLLRFRLRDTTLKWDPRSLADLFVLLRRGNTTFSRYSADSGRLAGYPDTRPASMGLWRSLSSPTGFSHGIGIDTQIVGGLYSPPTQFAALNPEDPNSPQPMSQFDSWQTEHPDGHPWLPWFLRPSMAALWMAFAVVFLLAFLIASWVNKAVVVGFNPMLFAGRTSSLNFSSANFLYGFLPALLGMFCYLLWQPIDATFRALQPFVEMQKDDPDGSKDGGATPDISVLLDYNAIPPVLVTAEALRKGHYRVAWFSFITPLAMVLPVLGGGVFQSQYIVGTVDTIHEIASVPGYVALSVFATIYALSYLLIWPSKAHRLPHDISTVADVADFVLGGRMLNDLLWKDPPTKDVLVHDLSFSKKLTGEKRREGLGNFRFGQHLGLDGKPRLGIFRTAS